MGLSIPSKIVGGTAQAALSPLGVVGTGLNTVKTTAGIVADTGRLLMDAIKNPFSKETYKKYGSRLSSGRNTYKADNKAGWKKFWSPYQGKRDQSYGISKGLIYPTHTVVDGLAYSVGTVLDTTWRAAATPFTWTGNMFLKKENKIKLWKEGWKNNMKKWRGSYKEGFKQLKKQSEGGEEKTGEKKENISKGPSEKEMGLEKENKEMKENISKMEKTIADTNEKLNKVLSEFTKKEEEVFGLKKLIETKKEDGKVSKSDPKKGYKDKPLSKKHEKKSVIKEDIEDEEDETDEEKSIT